MSKLAYVIRKLLRLSPQSSAPSSLEKGELYVDNTTGAPMYHNGSSESQVLTAAHSATLTNKTFDADGTGNSISNIENADIKTGAAIDHAKLANMTAGYILQGNASNVPTATQVTGDVTISSSGVTAIASGVIVNDDVNASAAIARSKLASGNNYRILANDASGVMSENAALTASRAIASDANGQLAASATTSTELGYVNGVTSAIQTQLDAKQARSTLTTKGDIYVATASATTTRLAAGTDGYILTADSAQTEGIKWAAAPSAPQQSYEISNLGLACSVAGNALTIALKQSDGSSDATAGSPVRIGFGSSTATSGAFNQRTVTSSLSIVISSGSTLGHLSSRTHYMYVYALDNAGTVELAVSSTRYDDGTLVSTTAEGGAGAADSASTIYSTTARSNVRIRAIARLKSNQTTAGTWAAVPTEISLVPFERVKAYIRAYTSGGQSITTAGSGETIVFDSERNNNNCYLNTGTGEVTVLVPGWYLIQGIARIENLADTAYAIGSIFLNGATILQEVSLGSSIANMEISPNCSTCYFLTIGDVITFTAQHNHGADRTASSAEFRTHLTLTKLSD